MLEKDMEFDYNAIIKKYIMEMVEDPDFNPINEIEELFRYKPVRLGWFVLRAYSEYRLTGDVGEALNILADKGLFSNESLFYQEYMDAYRFFFSLLGDTISVERMNFLQKKAQKEDTVEYDEKIRILAKKLLDRKDYGFQLEMADLLYITCDNPLLFMYLSITTQDREKWIRYREIEDGINFKFLKEYLERKKPWILIASKENEVLYQYIGRVLTANGYQVVYVGAALEYETENVHIKDTIQISIENGTWDQNMFSLCPIALIGKGKYISNEQYLLAYINRTMNSDCNILMLSEYRRIIEIKKMPYMKKKATILSAPEHDCFEKTSVITRFGEYLDYMSELLGLDCREALYKTPSVNFSIMIPVRNSITTLRSTLKTCLNQEYKGSYEIVISDNSSEGNYVIRDYIMSLKDEHIKYYRAPFELNLAKSFEFATYMTNGKYIIPIGADDGVFPWMLSVLDYVIENYPDEKVIAWDRGFYAWPGFNGGQQNQLSIPRAYQKNKISIRNVDTKKSLQETLKTPALMYGLPLLYINSCYRRDYLQDVLNATGGIFEGNSQDIYMGVLNCLVLTNYIMVLYPLSIAGMSSASIGASGYLMDSEMDQFRDRCAKFCRMQNECGIVLKESLMRLPGTGIDIEALMGAYVAMVDKGLILEEELSKIDWAEVYEYIVSHIDVRDIGCDKKMQLIIRSSNAVNEKLREKCGQVLNFFAERRFQDDLSEDNTRCYSVGRTEMGGLTLDASEYGVTNMQEAVNLIIREADLQ